MMDWIFEKLIQLCILLLLILLVGQLISVYKNVENCSRWETKIVHQDAWTQYVWSGKIMVPIYHAARDYNQEVCVERKK